LLILVCDNASDDETEEVVRQLAQKDSRVHYHRHATNVGSYNNFNYGINSVKTPFFSLLSDDDLLLPDFYRRAMQVLEHFPDAMFACMPTMVVDADCNVVSKPVLVETTRLNFPAEGLTGPKLRPIPEAWTGILFRTDVRDSIGVIDSDAGPFADGAYVMHAAARFAFVDVPGVGAVLMAHEASTSGTVKPVDGEWVSWWDRMIRRIETDNAVPVAARARLRTREVLNIAAFNIRKIAILQVLKSVSAGNIVYAKRAAAGAKECGYPFVSRMLELLVLTERWTRLVRPALWCVSKFRKALHHRVQSHLNQHYAGERALIMNLHTMARGVRPSVAE
jgi:glycosyltransferase involved in cell wall biosynthesis